MTEQITHPDGGTYEGEMEKGKRHGHGIHLYPDGGVYEGGWQECFPNGGQSVLYKGAELPFHGELLTVPFAVEVLEDTAEVVSVRLSVETMRTPFRLDEVMEIELARELTAEAIGDFLYHVPDYAERLKSYEAAGNDAIKAKLDELLENDCALAREFHERRQ